MLLAFDSLKRWHLIDSFNGPTYDVVDKGIHYNVAFIASEFCYV
ncbi:hypothetical protein [Borrelia coriaceae]|uniref:Uncharacterized protein n=1 Tax=Borrelia coriaceae ATCC 43381 TaxID=1408429 RepID=W5SWE8_9SPIR|nr:hypothetical protein [Borrelia coriaceae]AHH11212.1 hypothetical protein BCO_0900047 [Borrelia coriaceae ATCC 43381]